MKKKTIAILALTITILFIGFWYATHYPKASDSITLQDGTVVTLTLHENTMVFLDAEVEKNITIESDGKSWSHCHRGEDYTYSLFLIKVNQLKFWAIHDRFQGVKLAPYSSSSVFLNRREFGMPENCDTLCHITFNNFKLEAKYMSGF